ncbi:MAG: ParB N-terminal domain-containing protein [Acidobacteria bacterium]|nr:ParB N-terminal domain-containing protein [Acidobacteriota bacterium]
MGKEFHAVAELFPLMRGTAFEELVADIKKNGLREPILCDAEGRILDGRNRYRACLEAGVEPRFVTWEGEGSLPELALSLNLRRRHLDESQRALVAARLAKMLEAGAIKRRGKRLEKDANLHRTLGGRSAAHAAATVNVSTRLVNSALKVLKDGCPELIQEVESGSISVSKASILAVLPQAEQAQAAAGGPEALARKAREMFKPRPVGLEPWPFGVENVNRSRPHEPAIATLWVASGGLFRAVEVLKAAGFRERAAR